MVGIAQLVSASDCGFNQVVRGSSPRCLMKTVDFYKNCVGIHCFVQDSAKSGSTYWDFINNFV